MTQGLHAACLLAGSPWHRLFRLASFCSQPQNISRLLALSRILQRSTIHPQTQTGTLYHPHPPSSISFHKTLFAPPPHRALPLLAILNFPLPATPSPPLSHNDRLLSPSPGSQHSLSTRPPLPQPAWRPPVNTIPSYPYFFCGVSLFDRAYPSGDHSHSSPIPDPRRKPRTHPRPVSCQQIPPANSLAALR